MSQTAAPKPPSLDQACLRAEHHYRVLGTPPEEAFDRLTALTAQLLRAPAALLGFADCERIWFKSSHGLELTEVPRDSGFFTTVFETSNVVQVRERPAGLNDAELRADWRFVAGIAVRCPEGNPFGGLWVVDTEPRRLTPEQEASLRHLAELVVPLLELRRQAGSPWPRDAAAPGPPTVERIRDSLHGALIGSGDLVVRALEASSDMMAVTTLDDGLVLRVNDTFVARTGFDRHQVAGRSMTDLGLWVRGEDREWMVSELRQRGKIRDYEFAFRTRSGEVRSGSLSAETLPVAGTLCMVSSVRDVTDDHRDATTGLPNRRRFLDRLRRALERARTAPGSGLAVLLLDVDRFKVINDSLGPADGDRVLAVVAERLRTGMRPVDTVARLGGDEFVVLVESAADPCRAVTVAERIAESLRVPVELDGKALALSASVGIVEGPADYESAEELLRDAEIAMYRAKVTQPGRHVRFAPEMHASALARLWVEHDLRYAVERDELELEYQPVVECRSGRVVGLEALIRWRHPSRGLVSPVEFLDVAEETGLIHPIGRWVLSEACRQACRWDRPGQSQPLVVSVNLSVAQLGRPGLAAEVSQALRRSGLAPDRLWLEITESGLLKDLDQAAERLRRLQSLGVRVCLDDFGTGYSSMGYLSSLPLDVLKIDRCFVRDLETSGNREIVSSVLSLARRLGLEVVVEGIEAPTQLSLVEQLGCDYLQGFLLAPPLPVPDVDRLLDLGAPLKPVGSA